MLQGTVPHNKIAKIQAFHAHHNNIVASAADQAVTLSGSAPNCHNFSESGYKATYWAEQEIVPNSKKLYLLAMRQGHGKSVYLMTSNPDLGPGKWVVERSGTLNQCNGSIYNITNGTIETNDIQRHQNEVSCRDYFFDANDPQIRCVTQRQKDPMWFLLRMFCFTSTVSRKAMMTIRRHTNIDNPIHEMISEFAELFHLGEELVTEPILTLDDYNSMTLHELKDHCRPHKPMHIKGSGSMNRATLLLAIQAALLKNDNQTLDDEEEIYKAFFDAWFLQPSRRTAAMAEGNANERNVIQGIGSFMRAYSNLFIREIITTGLVLHVQHDFMATSVDGLFSFFFNKKNHRPSALHYGCLEIKTHVSPQVISQCEILAQMYGRISLAFAWSGSTVLSNSSANEHDIVMTIPNADHRAQIVHHAATLDEPIVMYVDATTESIIRIVIVCVCDEMRTKYSRLLQNISEKYLRWVYDIPAPILPIFSYKV